MRSTNRQNNHYKNPGLAWHPLRVMSRTDASLTTLYHCIFALERIDRLRDESTGVQDNSSQAQIRVALQIPERGTSRKYVKDLEDNLVLYFLNFLSQNEEVENCSINIPCAPTHNFGIVTFSLGDSKRFDGFWKSNKEHTKYLVAFSNLPLYSASREIFERLDIEQRASNILPMLHSMCEAPILPAAGLRYHLKFPSGNHVQLQFSEIEQLDDSDIFSVAMHSLNPRILILAWESLVLERKVLVVSSHIALLAPCCQFLKRLVLPMPFENSCIFHLPDINYIDAPVPYLYGVSSQRLRSSGADLSEVVVIDLDAGQISIPPSDAAKSQCAPPSLISYLMHELNALWSTHLAAWIARSSNSESWASPMSSEPLAEKANAVVHIFIRQNLKLLSARSCGVTIFTGAFCRLPSNQHGSDIFGNQVVEKLSSRPSGDLDIVFNQSAGGNIKSGALILLNKNKRCLQVWVEVDSAYFSVYRYEDELAILRTAIGDIQSVVGIPMEPEGHIFEIVTSMKTSYVFQAADPDVRLKWITLLDGAIVQKGSSAVASGPVSRAEKDHAQAAMQSNSVHQDSIFGFGEVDDHVHATQVSHHHSKHVHTVDSSSSQSGGSTKSDSNINYYNKIVSFVGNSAHSLRTPLNGSCSVLSAEDDEEMMTAFRTLFLQTQIVTYLDEKSRIGEGKTYDALFTEIGDQQINYEISQNFLQALLSGPGTVLLSTDSRISSVAASFATSNLQSDYETSVEAAPIIAKVEPDLNPVSASTTAHATNPQSARLNSAQQSMCTKCGTELQRKNKGGFFGIFQPKMTICESCSAPTTMGKVEMDDKRREYLEAKSQVRIFLNKLAMVHQSCEDELHSGIMEQRIEAAAELVQHHADVRRGIKPNLPIVISLGSNSKGLTSASDLFTELWTVAEQVEQSTSNYCKESREQLISSLTAQLPIYEGEVDYTATSHTFAILQAQLGYLHEVTAQYDKALLHYSRTSFVEQERIMLCLAAKLVATMAAEERNREELGRKDPAWHLWTFFNDAAQLSPLVLLQSYRLTVQLAHRQSIAKLLDAYQEDPLEQQRENQDLRSNLDELSPFMNRSGLAGPTERNNFAEHTNRDANSAAAATFSKDAPGGKKDVNILNEAYFCSSSRLASDHPCKLSHSLATRLNELVLVYCQSEGVGKYVKRTSMGLLKISISLQADRALPIKEIRSQSAFREFEIQVCELQQVDLTKLGNNAEKLVFWVNLYNVLCLHAILVRGSPGSNQFERFGFMKVKYRIGPHYFSLFEIEHGLLRSSSSKPTSFALPFLPVFSPIQQRDPRKVFALTERVPLMNFALFTATQFSPPFLALQDPKKLKGELSACCRDYIRHFVRVHKSDLTIQLPSLFWLYWGDFAPSDKAATVKIDVVKLLLRHAPSPLREALEEVVKPSVSKSTSSSNPPTSLMAASSDRSRPNAQFAAGAIGVASALLALSEERSRANMQFKFAFDRLSFEPQITISSRGSEAR